MFFGFIVLSLLLWSAGCGSSEKVIQVALSSIQETDDVVLQEQMTSEAVSMGQTAIAKTENAAATKGAKDAIRSTKTAVAQTEAVPAAQTQTQTAIPRNCVPGRSYSDFLQDAEKGYFDIVRVETNLEGEELTVTFYLQELPEEITVNTEKKGYPEYAWVVLIDIDNDTATGSSWSEAKGVENDLSLFRLSQGGEPLTGSFEKAMKGWASVWELENDFARSLEDASVVFDRDEGSITLKGVAPGINQNSRLYFLTETNSVEDKLCY